MTKHHFETPETQSFLSQIDGIRRRLADLRVKAGMSPYQPMPDRILLKTPPSEFVNAVNRILETTERGSPTPTILPPKKRSPRKS